MGHPGLRLVRQPRLTGRHTAILGTLIVAIASWAAFHFDRDVELVFASIYLVLLGLLAEFQRPIWLESAVFLIVLLAVNVVLVAVQRSRSSHLYETLDRGRDDPPQRAKDSFTRGPGADQTPTSGHCAS